MQKEIFEKTIAMGQAALEPLTRCVEINNRAIERLARQNMAAFGQGLDLANRQIQSVGQAQSPQDHLAQQANLATEVAKIIKTQAENGMELVMETQAELATWAETTTRGAVDAAQEGARTVATQFEQGVKTAAKATKKAA